MLQRGVERFRGIGQEVGRLVRNAVGGEAESVVDTTEFHRKAVRFYEFTYNLLESAGAYRNNHFHSWEDKAFLAERVAANFLEGVFPQGNNRPINGRRNKGDSKLLGYIREHLPPTMVFSPEDTPEEVTVERLLNSTARDIYLIFCSDALRKGNTDQLANDIMDALQSDTPLVSYVPSYQVRSEIQSTLDSYKEEYQRVMLLQSGDK